MILRNGSSTEVTRGGSRAAATSKMECFVIIVNGRKTLTIITKRSILDVAAGLDPPLRHAFLNNDDKALSSLLHLLVRSFKRRVS